MLEVKRWSTLLVDGLLGNLVSVLSIFRRLFRGDRFHYFNITLIGENLQRGRNNSRSMGQSEYSEWQHLLGGKCN